MSFCLDKKQLTSAFSPVLRMRAQPLHLGGIGRFTCTRATTDEFRSPLRLIGGLSSALISERARL